MNRDPRLAAVLAATILAPLVLIALVILFSTVLGGRGEQTPEATPSTTTSPDASSTAPPQEHTNSLSHGVRLDRDTALMVLNVIPVEEQGTLAGYDNRAFAPGKEARDGDWPDMYWHCTAAAAVLIRDALSTDVDNDSCSIKSGTWADPFTGEHVDDLVRMSPTFAVPPEEVWKSGGADWTPEQRRIFGSMQSTFVAATKDGVRDREGQNIADWHPTSPTTECLYAARWVAVKNDFGLTMTEDEKAYLEKALSNCPADLVGDEA